MKDCSLGHILIVKGDKFILTQWPKNNLENKEMQKISYCDIPKPEGLLTNRQLTENYWISGDPIPYCYVPFTGIHNFNKN